MLAPSPTIPTEHGTGEWVKKQIKTLAGWLKALARKVAAVLLELLVSLPHGFSRQWVQWQLG